MVDKERRGHRRDHVNIPAELLVHGIHYPCRIRNISGGGFFVETDVFLSVEENVLLTAKDISMVEKAGKTLRIDTSGIGGKFDEEEDITDIDTH